MAVRTHTWFLRNIIRKSCKTWDALPACIDDTAEEVEKRAGSKTNSEQMFSNQ
jgi:hypothetical protein